MFVKSHNVQLSGQRYDSAIVTFSYQGREWRHITSM